MKRVRLGSATGWARDRFEPALELVRHGNVDYLCFDSMSEVTMSAAQVQRMEETSTVPYDPYLRPRMEPILKECKQKGIRIITNQGWLDPVAAADEVLRIARQQGIDDLKVAAVVGGILTDRIADMNLDFVETGTPIAERRADIVSAEVYLGAEGIVEALRQQVDVVITTRVADACVYLGPLAHEFGWRFDDHHLIAKGMIVGHLLECGSQISGGYFADPGYKNVPDLDNIGNPIADVTEDRVIITKLPNTGGVVSEATCKEQLLYEVQDPSRYLCPDVIADFTKVSFLEVGENAVEVIVRDAGLPKTPTLKALIGLNEGFMTEEMVLLAGPGALARAELTKDILRKRFKRVALDAEEIRMDYVGINGVHRESSPAPVVEPYEVVLRIAVKTKTRQEAEKLRREVDPLAVNGVSGTGKWATSAPGSRVRPIVGLSSALVPREEVSVTLYINDLQGVTTETVISRHPSRPTPGIHAVSQSVGDKSTTL
jgi:Acyclic terpene utilisation family protein AtuA